ncbi:MAG: RidA family protein [Pseudohongiellaceae bacterium]
MKNPTTRRSFLRTSAMLTCASTIPFALAQGPKSIESRLSELGISLPPVAPPVANYVAYQVAGNMAYIAGQIPFLNGELMHPGKVPSQVSIEQATAAARQCGINILAALKEACEGDLDRVNQCVRIQGFVASDDTFTAQPTIINGVSNLMVDVFGDAGKHTRLALGSNTLPLDACVEVSAIFSID